jgi:CRP-like cAMP-binding protein
MFAEIQETLVSCRDCKEKSCAAAVLDVTELDLINANRSMTSFKKGDIIVHEGSMTSHIIYLKSGLVKEYVKGTNDKEQILQIVKSSTYLGLSSLFGSRINQYSYAALADIHVCYIDVNVFNQLVKQNGKFAYEILVSVCRDNLNNFHRFMSQSQKKTYGRVAEAILYFSNVIFENQVFEMPFSRKELADLIGISRESATRVLSKFMEDGILTLKGRSIRIINIQMLKQISKNG